MRMKNALRGHFVQDVVKGQNEPVEANWLELAKWISTVSDDTNEETEESAYYDGDGTKQSTVVSVQGAYTFEGSYDREDKAQELIASKKYKTGDDRLVWHKVVDAGGKKQWIGKATASEIVAGGGEASGYEEFKAKLTYNEVPKESVPTNV